MSEERFTIFQTISLMLATAGVVVTALGYLKEPDPNKSEVVLQNFNAIELLGNDVVEFVAAQGTDKQGHSAKMVISVLSKEFNWVMGSTTAVELNGENINYVDYLGSDSFIKAFNECEDIILLGMASKEGAQKYEEQRAYKRGIQLSVWLRSLINENPHIHLLNIGQYQGPKDVETSIQRRIVLVCIYEKDESVDLRTALYASLIGNPAFKFPLKQYSMFGDITNMEQIR